MYDTDFPVHALAPSEGQRATALSGTMAVNINRVAVQSDTLPNSANYFGVYRGAYQNGAVAAPAEPDLCQRSSVQLLPEIVPVQTIFFHCKPLISSTSRIIANRRNFSAKARTLLLSSLRRARFPWTSLFRTSIISPNCVINPARPLGLPDSRKAILSANLAFPMISVGSPSSASKPMQYCMNLTDSFCATCASSYQSTAAARFSCPFSSSTESAFPTSANIVRNRSTNGS